MAAAPDDQILDRATKLDRVVFTQDFDFFEIAYQWLASGRETAGIIYARQMSITVGQAVNDIELIAQVMDPNEMKNHIERIPLKSLA